MDLTKLRYFYVVAKHEHVTRAAEEIHIAQPALTKTIKQLEEELETPLFFKQGRNIRLTGFGKYLRDKLAGVFAQLDAIPQELKTLKAEREREVKINVLSATTVVTDAVVAYKKKHSEAVFGLIRNETETDCDISVSTEGVDQNVLPAFSRRCIMEEKVYLAVPKSSAYAGRESIALKECKDEGFVHLAGSRLFRNVCDRFCAYAGFKPKISFESDSLSAVKNIIGAGAGVGFWPEYTWGKVSGEIRLLPITDPVCSRELIVGLHETATPSDTALDFYDFLLKFLQKCRKRGSI
ncbi:MAG: LysR family transcriptional regulator [Clostridia bacterium]|nr:LysR family transcriptional regulator [Clostridia bacterium]